MTCFAARPGPLYTWMTCSRDQREHAIPDPVLDSLAAATSLPRAFCGHFVAERCASLFVPPGPRCLCCQSRIEQQRRGLPQPRRPLCWTPASLLVLVKRAAWPRARPLIPRQTAAGA